MVLMGVNVLLTIAAIAGLTFGLIERDSVESVLQEVCHSCNMVYIIYIAGLSALLGFSLLGFLALCSRNLCLRVLYFLHLLVVFLVALTVSVVYTLVGSEQLDLETGWNDAATHNSEALCAFELKMECSGWKTPCNVVVGDSWGVQRYLDAIGKILLGEEEQQPQQQAAEVHTREEKGRRELKTTSRTATILPSFFVKVNDNTMMATCPVCEPNDQKKINTFTSTCRDVVMGTIKEYMKIILPVGYSVAGVAFIGMMVTWMLHHKVVRHSRYSGRYYRV
ncbi:Tetraspanin/Peripherin [Trypanosoma melophagium]|uniref:Tetraspanin/Peripherin n=1 Tax=Trypanosoma melophagium TaxID=715481 RepID=UPI00351A2792|nr:Tetraspanin/Peripherin [Trypanosoma melophagium]